MESTLSRLSRVEGQPLEVCDPVGLSADRRQGLGMGGSSRGLVRISSSSEEVGLGRERGVRFGRLAKPSRHVAGIATRPYTSAPTTAS
jgi:hypothetical protein